MPGDFNMTIQNDPLGVAVESMPELPTLNVHVDNMPEGGGAPEPGPQPGELVFSHDLVIEPGNPGPSSEVLIPVPSVKERDAVYRVSISAHPAGRDFLWQPSIYFQNAEFVDGQVRYMHIYDDRNVFSPLSLFLQEPNQQRPIYGFLVGSAPSRILIGNTALPSPNDFSLHFHVRVYRV